MKRIDISILGGYYVTVEFKDGTSITGFLEKAARRWWVESKPIVPRDVKRIRVHYDQLEEINP